ncbi:MAG: aminotransferase class I/II-fold pyridoxal phosphate-dependent enzyme, partial [Pseudomonadales bacterium]|nr:aminotransferase class I/II-fold pyridoxal phosphate-dependent enzyme [Pseudomonadales bacterium]
AAMQAALGDKQFLTKIIDNNTQQRAWLRRQLDDLGIHYWPSQANFICFKAPNGKTAQQIVELLLTYGVMVRAAFYLPNCVRVSIGQADANRQFIKAMSEIIDQTSGGTEL